jgi:hypothetical protein
MVNIVWRFVPLSLALYYLIYLAFGWRGVIAVMLIGWGAFIWEIL